MPCEYFVTVEYYKGKFEATLGRHAQVMLFTSVLPRFNISASGCTGTTRMCSRARQPHLPFPAPLDRAAQNLMNVHGVSLSAVKYFTFRLPTLIPADRHVREVDRGGWQFNPRSVDGAPDFCPLVGWPSERATGAPSPVYKSERCGPSSRSQ